MNYAALALISGVAIGCGDDDCCKYVPGSWHPDATATTDATAGDGGAMPGADAIVVTPDAAVTICTADPSYGAFTAAGTAKDTAGPPHTIEYALRLGVNSPFDALFVDLFAGSGAFSTGDIRTGTFSITGDDARPSTCGVCVLVVTDVVTSGSSFVSFADYYAATSGTVTLTSVDIHHIASDGFAHLTGSLSVTLRHVGRDSQDQPTDTIVDNCATFVTGNFDAKLTAGT
jgi:hypothetical protein